MLGDLRDEFVFVGGCTTGLLITDPAAANIRPTFDVDVIVATASVAEYYAIAKRLRALGFHEDTKVICRWKHRNDLTLDVMPTDRTVLGFANKWYAGAIAHAVDCELEAELVIRVVTPPYFCATKIEAFHGRGNGDYAGSHDLEDFLAVVDGRPELVAEIQDSRRHGSPLSCGEIRDLLARQEFLDALPGSLMPDAASQARLPLLLSRLEQIAAG